MGLFQSSFLVVAPSSSSLSCHDRERKLVWGILVMAASSSSSCPRHYHHVTVNAFHTHAVSQVPIRPINNHRMGKSRLVVGPRQESSHDRTGVASGSVHETKDCLSSPEILQLAKANAKRSKGSRAYQSSWRHFLEQTTRAIRQELMMNLPHPVHDQELDQLSFQLGIAADQGTMPSFAHPGARSGYALEYLCRARLLAGLVLQTNVIGDDMAGLSILQQHHQQQQEDPTRTIHLSSLGGGPGFDFVALAMAIVFSQSANDNTTTATTTTTSTNVRDFPTLRATILDYEEGWSDLVQAMKDATINILQHSTYFHCQWGGPCDITLPLSHPINQACFDAIATTNLWTCQYCIAENAQKLRASNYAFFQELWRAMPDQSIMILTETTPRLWPELYHALKESCRGDNTTATATTTGSTFQVTFPNYKGPQMMLRKSSSSTSFSSLICLSDQDMQLLTEFQEISAKHEERHKSGWTRQVKKNGFTNVAS